jgi:hypothetical protein
VDIQLDDLCGPENCMALSKTLRGRCQERGAGASEQRVRRQGVHEADDDDSRVAVSLRQENITVGYAVFAVNMQQGAARQ